MEGDNPSENTAEAQRKQGVLGVLVDSLEEVALGQVRRDEGGGGR